MQALFQGLRQSNSKGVAERLIGAISKTVVALVVTVNSNSALSA